MPPPETRLRAPAAGLWLIFAVLLLWPAAINGGALLFYDSLVYLEQGRAGVEGIWAILAARLQGGGGGAGHEAVASSATFVRSLPWSAFAFVSSITPIGLLGPVLLQSLMVAGLVLLLLAPAAPPTGLALPAALGALALFTTLPWYASTLMPDILAAVIILCGMLLVRQWPGGTPHTRHLFIVGLVTTFAILAHYGHLPLAGVMAGVVLLLLLAGRRLTLGLALAALLPICLALGLNMLASRAAFETAEVAPKRLPILLARSIEDGPARWYLERACPQSGYALCPYVAALPASAGEVLFGSDSPLSQMAPQEIEAVRREEMQVLAGAFRAYPVQQGWSFVRNGVRQVTRFGFRDVRWGTAQPGADGRLEADVSAMTDRGGLALAQRVVTGTVLLSAVAILALALRDRLSIRTDERALLAVLVVGLLANAFIFGGLSAPADRYQARVVWLVPLLALLFLLNRMEAKR